jgi:beta-xylosidase
MTFPLRRTAALAAALIGSLTCLAAAAPVADNPIVKNQFVADPSAHAFNGRVYLYLTNDSGNDGKYWNSRDWRALSSADMKRWTDHGSIFSVAGFKWAKALAWAPAAAHRGGWYYLYLPVDRTKIGVARSKSPVGPFKDARGGPIIDTARDANTGKEPIDPMVFVDRDGQSYMYFGSRTPKVVRLAPDMVRTAEPIKDVKIENSTVKYGEAPWLHRRGDVYYFSYSTGWPGQIAYATGSSPMGPFTHRGIVLDKVNTVTNHQAIVEHGGQWYLFYHHNALPGGGEHKRSTAVERLVHLADGSIRKVTPTKEGLSASYRTVAGGASPGAGS